MDKLIVRDRVIDENIFNILAKIQGTCKNGKLSQYKLSGSGIAVTCPHHANGQEKHPSCYINLTNDDVPFGYTHCFTCNFSGSFSKFAGECFNRDEDYGESWLISNYANIFAVFLATNIFFLFTAKLNFPTFPLSHLGHLCFSLFN